MSYFEFKNEVWEPGGYAFLRDRERTEDLINYDNVSLNPTTDESWMLFPSKKDIPDRAQSSTSGADL